MKISRTIAFAASAVAITGAVSLAFAQVDPANPNSSTSSPAAGAPQGKSDSTYDRSTRRDRRSMGDNSTGRNGMSNNDMSNNGMPNSGPGTVRTDGTLSTNPSATTTAPGSTNGANVAPSGGNSRNYSRDNSSGASLNDSGTERVARADRN
jgi:hypothetical protein